MNYAYPMDETWSTQEIIDVVNFFSLIEQAYEKKVRRTDLLHLYRRFKEIVPSKSREKQLFEEFKRSSGYSSYHVVKKARESEEALISMT
ncbi:UPF0223 family protein [Oceanobacillus neutriphilus]|uniref:UPF0223 protein GCM10011346_39470 n=1 Tax=Oceanobacillus neutriphilus TaxID=531815 RepID=A0ABQ2P076_9BACI|nr:UPF0223 family protein [Oceanobacillus neutriphilus]GGP14654.1 UPF0223 protein YktA [Oceanobacillus neutriphilus]